MLHRATPRMNNRRMKMNTRICQFIPLAPMWFVKKNYPLDREKILIFHYRFLNESRPVRRRAERSSVDGTFGAFRGDPWARHALFYPQETGLFCMSGRNRMGAGMVFCAIWWKKSKKWLLFHKKNTFLWMADANGNCSRFRACIASMRDSGVSESSAGVRPDPSACRQQDALFIRSGRTNGAFFRTRALCSLR
jgi:hypothetical protein